MAATIYVKSQQLKELSPEQTSLFNKYRDQAQAWAHSLGLKMMPGEGGTEAEFADFILYWAVQTYDPTAKTKFTTWLYTIMSQQSKNLYKKWRNYLKQTGGGERSLAEPVQMPSGEEAVLEDFLKNIKELSLEDQVAYNLLRDKIQERLRGIGGGGETGERYFLLYRLLFEEGVSNPQAAKALGISPARVTGLRKRIVQELMNLPEVQEMMSGEDVEEGASSTSSLRHFLYRKGDKVVIKSISKVGRITEIYQDNVVDVELENKNPVRTTKSDLTKHTTLIESSRKVLTHFFNSTVQAPRCYVSLITKKNEEPSLTILELRPVTEREVTARLFFNNNLIGIATITEADPDSLFVLLRGHIGIDSSLELPFVSVHG